MKGLVSKVLLPFFQLYWIVFRPEIFGAKCVIKSEGKILMIRASYGRGKWTFPGGTIEKGESPEQAVIREVEEEVGLKISQPRYLGNFLSTWEHARDTIHCFSAEADTDILKVDLKEVRIAQWFSLGKLPEPIGRNAQTILEVFLKSESSPYS